MILYSPVESLELVISYVLLSSKVIDIITLL